MLKGCHWPALLTWIIWAAERMKYATGTCDLWWIVKRSRGRIDVVESKKQGVENKQTKKSWTSHMTGDMFKGWNWPSRLLWSIKDILKGIGLDEKTGRMWLRERNRVWEINKQIKVEPVTWLNQANPTSGCSLSKKSDTKEKKGARWLSSRWRKRTRKKVGWKKVQPCHLTCLGQSSLE
jgi:hypothetical protein